MRLAVCTWIINSIILPLSLVFGRQLTGILYAYKVWCRIYDRLWWAERLLSELVALSVSLLKTLDLICIVISSINTFKKVFLILLYACLLRIGDKGSFQNENRTKPNIRYSFKKKKEMMFKVFNKRQLDSIWAYEKYIRIRCKPSTFKVSTISILYLYGPMRQVGIIMCWYRC